MANTTRPLPTREERRRVRNLSGWAFRRICEQPPTRGITITLIIRVSQAAGRPPELMTPTLVAAALSRLERQGLLERYEPPGWVRNRKGDRPWRLSPAGQLEAERVYAMTAHRRTAATREAVLDALELLDA